MDRDILYQNLMEAIKQKIPLNKNVVNVLMEILQLQKEAVYRRISGKVPFSFFEIVTISEKLDFSLDDIVNPSYSNSKPSGFLITEFIDPTANYYTVLEEMVMLLRSLKENENAEGCEATNTLPQPIYLMHENISRYFLFKWELQNRERSEIIPYKDITIPPKLREIQLENAHVIENLHTGNYIFDNLLFHHLAEEIKLFRSIDLISEEECRLIKADLFSILEFIQNLAKKGHYENSGNKINIYISAITIPTSYCYIRTDEIQLSLIKAFSINGVTSTEKKIFEKVKCWLDSFKRHSTLISQTGEKERTHFINDQRLAIQSI